MPLLSWVTLLSCEQRSNFKHEEYSKFHQNNIFLGWDQEETSITFNNVGLIEMMLQ